MPKTKRKPGTRRQQKPGTRRQQKPGTRRTLGTRRQQKPGTRRKHFSQRGGGLKYVTNLSEKLIKDIKKLYGMEMFVINRVNCNTNANQGYTGERHSAFGISATEEQRKHNKKIKKECNNYIKGKLRLFNIKLYVTNNELLEFDDIVYRKINTHLDPIYKSKIRTLLVNVIRALMIIPQPNSLIQTIRNANYTMPEPYMNTKTEITTFYNNHNKLYSYTSAYNEALLHPVNTNEVSLQPPAQATIPVYPPPAQATIPVYPPPANAPLIPPVYATLPRTAYIPPPRTAYATPPPAYATQPPPGYSPPPVYIPPPRTAHTPPPRTAHTPPNYPAPRPSDNYILIGDSDNVNNRQITGI